MRIGHVAHTHVYARARNGRVTWAQPPVTPGILLTTDEARGLVEGLRHQPGRQPLDWPRYSISHCHGSDCSACDWLERNP